MTTDRTLFDLLRQDVARWIEPGEIGDPAVVTPALAAKLAVRHMGLQAVMVMRVAVWAHQRGIRGVPGLLYRWIQRRYGLDILVSGVIGGGLYIAHPSGVTLAPESMGENCSVIAAVTVGMRNERTFPIIGDRVFIGAGARVLGGIEIGDDVKIGANAVVIRSVTDGMSVGGIPARELSAASPIKGTTTAIDSAVASTPPVSDVPGPDRGSRRADVPACAEQG